jgi:hypothetical protein
MTSKSQIAMLLAGEHVETGGLHFMATPDTQILMNEVKIHTQGMLDLVTQRGHHPRIITSQTFPSYGQFANGESIATIESSVR